RGSSRAQRCSFDWISSTRGSASYKMKPSSSVFTNALLAFHHLLCELAGPLRHVRASRALRLLRDLRPIPRPTAGNEPAHRQTGCLAAGRPRMVPTFTASSIDQIGAQLYPDSIATPTP